MAPAAAINQVDASKGILFGVKEYEELITGNPYVDDMDMELWNESPCEAQLANVMATDKSLGVAGPSQELLPASTYSGFTSHNLIHHDPARAGPGLGASAFPLEVPPLFADVPVNLPSAPTDLCFNAPSISIPSSLISNTSVFGSSSSPDDLPYMPAGFRAPLLPVPQHQPSFVTHEQAGIRQSCVASFQDGEPTKAQMASFSSLAPDSEASGAYISSDVVRVSGSGQRKKLFGEGGWLDHRDMVTEAPSVPRPPQLHPASKSSKTIYSGPEGKPGVIRGLSKKIKGYIAEFTEDSSNPPLTTNGSKKSNVPISLKPNLQARLYSDLEIMICSTANRYLLRQYYDGRVSQHSISKVNNFWQSKNRPSVTEFYFDQATQLRLIMANRCTLQFGGESSTNPIKLHSNLRNWKVIAQEMSVRTFCLPDSAIRKHLYDLQSILDMLDAPIETLRSFQALSFRAQQQMAEFASQMSRSQSQRSL